MQKKIIIGISGGVDSSVSAYLLIKQGFKVEALFMKNWDEDDNNELCSFKQDFTDAQEVCTKLNIKLHFVNFAAEYWEKVFIPMIEMYKQGLTPNPDILCNKFIKFDLFFEYAKILGADYIATGHYARKENAYKDRLFLSKDVKKDQTYFLHAINKKVLNYSLFPLGNYLKTEVRQIAKDIGLINFAKQDSTGICFIGKRNMQTFLQKYIPIQKGKIINEQKKEIGEHIGVCFYTLGQRSGLNIGGIKNSTQEAWFVSKKDLKNNILTVAQGFTNDNLYSQTIICKNINWLKENNNKNCLVRLRHQAPLIKAQIIKLDQNNKNKIKFFLAKKQKTVSPGQYVVMYDNLECLGGGMIYESS